MEHNAKAKDNYHAHRDEILRGFAKSADCTKCSEKTFCKEHEELTCYDVIERWSRKTAEG